MLRDCAGKPQFWARVRLRDAKEASGAAAGHFDDMYRTLCAVEYCWRVSVAV